MVIPTGLENLILTVLFLGGRGGVFSFLAKNLYLQFFLMRTIAKISHPTEEPLMLIVHVPKMSDNHVVKLKKLIHKTSYLNRKTNIIRAVSTLNMGW